MSVLSSYPVVLQVFWVKEERICLLSFGNFRQKMCVPRTYMPENNHVKSEKNNCREIFVPLHIAVVTNL